MDRKVDVDSLGRTTETVSTARTYYLVGGELREAHIHVLYEPPGGYVDVELPGGVEVDIPGEDVGR